MSTINYKTRSATKKEIAAHLQKCKDNFIPSLDKSVDIDDYSKKLADKAFTFEAWNGEELAGLIAGYFNDPLGQTGFITNVSVVKEYSGEGIASQLLLNCVEYAKIKGYMMLKLEVNETNERAIKLYEKYNFKGSSNNAGMNTMILDLS